MRERRVIWYTNMDGERMSTKVDVTGMTERDARDAIEWAINSLRKDGATRIKLQVL